jgi:hypothetical protein
MTTSVLSTPHSATRLRASLMATHAVFASDVISAHIEARAVGYIRSTLTGEANGLPSSTAINASPPPEPTPGIVWEGSQSDLRNVATPSLLTKLTVPPRYRPAGNPKWWVNRMLFGGCNIDQPEQLQKDLGLDLERHAANLHSLRDSCLIGWRRLVRGNLLGLYQLAETTPQHARLIRSVVHDHIILTGVVRARMLAEYLRRLATEPMGPRLDIDDPIWVKRGALFVDRLAKPAKSLDQLLSKPDRGVVYDTPQEAFASAQFEYDPRLLQMAERISQQLSGLNLEGGYSTVLIRAVRTAIAPLTAITPAMLRYEGLGRQSFAEAQLGLSVSEAVTVLAINLVALKRQVEEALVALDGGLLLPAYPPAPAIPKDGGKKVARTAIALKKISGCDRHVGSRSTLSDNKAGKSLVSDIKRRLAVATALPVFEQLRLLPPEWSR